MRLIPVVSSSRIAGIAYDPEQTDHMIYVQFNDGDVYAYETETELQAQSWLATMLYSPSVGKAFSRFKDAGFPYHKLTSEEAAELEFSV